MSLESIDSEDLKQLLGDEKVDFVLNVSREPYISAKALRFSNDNNFGIGGLGDLMRALRDHNLCNYVNPEVAFILRGLRQHTRVQNVTRMDNRRYNIERYDLPSVIIVALNDYDLTAESVRGAIDYFPKFKAILTSNPNCRRSKSSIIAASSAGIKILSWGEVLGYLNKQWT